MNEAASNTQIWILSIVATALFTILGFLLRGLGSLVLKELKEIVTELRSLKLSWVTAIQDIKNLKEQVGDHEQRIRKLE